MSKLKIALSSGFAVASLAGIFMFCKSSPEVAYANNKALSEPVSVASEVWGKSNAPVLVKIDELSKANGIVELKGSIRSKLTNLQTEWKLPEGSYIVDGTANKSAARNQDGSFTEDIVKIDISGAKDEPIVFVAFVEKDGERVGHSRVYMWNVSEQDKEHVQKIRAKMKARKSKMVR